MMIWELKGNAVDQMSSSLTAVRSSFTWSSLSPSPGEVLRQSRALRRAPPLTDTWTCALVLSLHTHLVPRQ